MPRGRAGQALMSGTGGKLGFGVLQRRLDAFDDRADRLGQRLGCVTPPVGMNLFLSAYRFNKPLLEGRCAALPLPALLLAVVLPVTCVPSAVLGV